MEKKEGRTGREGQGRRERGEGKKKDGGGGRKEGSKTHQRPNSVKAVANSVQFSCSIMSSSLQPYGLQPSRFLCLWKLSRQEYWSRLSCPPPGDLPNPGIKPGSPALWADSLPAEQSGKPRDSFQFSSVQFSHSVVSDFLCPMNHSPPGLPVHHQLLEFTQTHVHRVSGAIQPSHPLSSPSPPAPNPSQHQGLFQ